jgi:hypothetical protein
MFKMAEYAEWIPCDDPDPKINGFAIKVRTDMTNAEQARLEDLHDDIVDNYQPMYRENVKELIEKKDWEAIDKLTTPRGKELELLAPFILDWTAGTYNFQTEEWEIAPPPAQVGPSAFDFVIDEAKAWMIHVVLMGYISTGKVRRSVNVSGLSSGTPSPEDQEPDSTPSDLPESSSEPSESTSST